jgi:S-(hydroxymethyl)glutathione dehydrogenase / alcohol dehydrogenase
MITIPSHDPAEFALFARCFKEDKVKAAVCRAFGQPLVIEDVMLDPPKTGEVKVRLTATAICHSDVHAIRGDWPFALPFIVGHESAGVVESIGEGVAQVKLGDTVVVSLLRSCGHCNYCLTDQPYYCSGTFALANEHRIHTTGGEVVRQGLGVAGFAEYVIVHQSQLVRVPSDMSLEVAALLACGVIAGYGAAVNTGQIISGSSVAVLGVGGVGLNAVQGAKLAGARQIIAIDLIETKLTAARQFGATHTINVSQANLVEGLRDITDTQGVDYVLVTVGSDSAINQSLSMVRKGGTVVIVGLPPWNKPATLPIASFVLNGTHLFGSWMGSTRLQIDVPVLIEHYQQGNLLLDELITARYPLEQINEAVEAMERGEALRNLIVF